MMREEALRVERRIWCRVVRARRWRNVECAGVAEGRARRGGTVVVERVYERPCIYIYLAVDTESV